MKKQDEIKVVKADIRRLKNHRNYLYRQYPFSNSDPYLAGIDDAIATLEKYLAKIEKGTKCQEK